LLLLQALERIGKVSRNTFKSNSRKIGYELIKYDAAK